MSTQHGLLSQHRLDLVSGGDCNLRNESNYFLAGAILNGRIQTKFEKNGDDIEDPNFWDQWLVDY